MLRSRRSFGWLVCAIAMAAPGFRAFGAPKRIPWQQDLAQAFASATKQRKVVMAEFFAPW
ncbi:MAG: hypothetical protein ACP5VE_04575 [Chthonomonadales bacterium]